MEQAGTLKLGPTANEFTAGQDGGKVVKFADVRGVEEAKEVRQRRIIQILTLGKLPLTSLSFDPHRSFKKSSSSVRLLFLSLLDADVGPR